MAFNPATAQNQARFEALLRSRGINLPQPAPQRQAGPIMQALQRAQGVSTAPTVPSVGVPSGGISTGASTPGPGIAVPVPSTPQIPEVVQQQVNALQRAAGISPGGAGGVSGGSGGASPTPSAADVASGNIAPSSSFSGETDNAGSFLMGLASAMTGNIAGLVGDAALDIAAAEAEARDDPETANFLRDLKNPLSFIGIDMEAEINDIFSSSESEDATNQQLRSMAQLPGIAGGGRVGGDTAISRSALSSLRSRTGVPGLPGGGPQPAPAPAAGTPTGPSGPGVAPGAR